MGTQAANAFEAGKQYAAQTQAALAPKAAYAVEAGKQYAAQGQEFLGAQAANAFEAGKQAALQGQTFLGAQAANAVEAGKAYLNPAPPPKGYFDPIKNYFNPAPPPSYLDTVKSFGSSAWTRFVGRRNQLAKTGGRRTRKHRKKF